MDEDEIPKHDHASDLEEEESIDNNETPHANGRPISKTENLSF
jgi:hypothetical protein